MSMFDKRPRVGRREAMYFMGSVMAVGFLSGCGNSEDGESSTPTPTSPSSTTTPTTTTSTSAQCVVTPSLTEGPYFVDERLNRSDLRADPATGVIKAGVPLTLALALSQISAGSGACTPLAGALVDVWHCDTGGLYSDIAQNGTMGQKFLRGYQLSDANGVAQFTSIYPGWYAGRAVHVHFKVRTNASGSSGLEFTSQMFFDESLTDVVHAQAPYNTRGRRDTTLTTDGIYRSGGTSVLVPLTAAGNGYAGTMNVGVRV
jgi:protocatechuate 3,4-dioxygenase beta subunit